MTEQHQKYSRRTAIKAGGISAGLLMVIGPQAGIVQASDVPAVVLEFIDGWEALDPDRITETFTNDGVREDITTSVVFEGHEEIHRSLEDFFAAFANAVVEHPNVLAGPGPFAADTWILTGEYVGTMPGFPSGNGQSLTIQGFTLIELVSDKISRTVDYYDAASIRAQIDK